MLDARDFRLTLISRLEGGRETDGSDNKPVQLSN